ncbi:MAG: hypothetical protein ACPGTO_03780 [Polaribacter sp.]
MKNSFIQNEIWILTFNGAFQRANIYKNKKVTEIERKDFKTKLRNHIENVILPFYSSKVNEKGHIESINQLSDFSKNFKSILNNGRLNFGVSQKLLNLFLKYQWTLNKIETPPHFPVDRIIQEKARIRPIISWTKITDLEKYLGIINAIRKIADKNNLTLAEFELELFNRR